MELYEIIKQNIYYEPYYDRLTKYDNNPIIEDEYCDTLYPVIKNIELKYKNINNVTNDLIYILSLLEKYNIYNNLKLNNTTYICFYYDSINVLKVINTSLKRDDFITIIDMHKLIDEIIKYNKNNQNKNNKKFLIILVLLCLFLYFLVSVLKLI